MQGDMGTEAMEEANICGFDQLDVDVRLPPRKRLLAGLKKQSCNCSSPSSPLSPISSGFSMHIRNLLSSDARSADLSPEEIVNAARSAAQAAIKVASAAKAVAEQKAAMAAKASAAARSALELVASVSEKITLKERYLRKNKSQKHVQVKLLYKNQVKNPETDEELARRLHRAMNSSPRISKTSARWKAYKNAKHYKPLTLEPARVPSRVVICERNLPSVGDSNAEEAEVDFGVSIPRVKDVIKGDEKSLECVKDGCSSMEGFSSDGEAEPSSYSEEKYWSELQATANTGRKRGRIKQKKLSLSLCTIRDRETPKEQAKTEAARIKCLSMPLLTVKPSTEAGAVSIWKHKEFKAPQCFAESKITHSISSNATVSTRAAMVEVDQ